MSNVAPSVRETERHEELGSIYLLPNALAGVPRVVLADDQTKSISWVSLNPLHPYHDLGSVFARVQSFVKLKLYAWECFREMMREV